jgi:hypothetical protein
MVMFAGELVAKCGGAKIPEGGLLGLPTRKNVENKHVGFVAEAIRSVWEWMKVKLEIWKLICH